MFNTKLEACREWVSRFDAIPMSVIEKLHEVDENDLFEVTPIVRGTIVYAFEHNAEGTVVGRNNKTLTVNLDSGETVEIQEYEAERIDYGYFPMWGTMWAFDDSFDEEWIEDHLADMAECGFRIYESEDYGYVFGIDGAGYDFYESHWLPLYDKRGLHWHKED